MIRKILGPPGTGKTTKLLKYVQTFLKLGTPIERIGYFAFTKKAATEAKERMLKLFPQYGYRDLRHFQTLHSLAFTSLGMKKDNVMQSEHYEEIGKTIGVQVSVYKGGEEETGYIDSDSEYFNLINIARIKDVSTKDEYDTDLYSDDMDYNLVEIIEAELNNYKKSFALYDFTDMIEKFIGSELCPKFDVVFIDEAQDLSPIQWKMYDIIKQNTKTMILAGDDDQAIYGWAGADVQRFQEEPAKEKILPQSYRVPIRVQQVADSIISQIDTRIMKLWNPRNEEGHCEEVYDLDEVDLTQGKWLVLARTNYRLIKMKPYLMERGIYFEYKERKSFSAKLWKAIRDFSRWTSGAQLTAPEIKDIFDYTGHEFVGEEHLSYDCEYFDIDSNDTWYELFNADPEQVLYIRQMLSNKEKLSEGARVKLSTIHSAKGGEADNVLLILDNTEKIREAIEKSPEKADEEHRVWYVGVTRTKQNLYIMAAKEDRLGYDIEGI
jgi:DNA helicase-2/ATP-dependent DNA helicase PcrA|tara:strand:- start:1074 stop:2552 length:1479 start_codon:yes stop_codon:yes gene_type:complete